MTNPPKAREWNILDFEYANHRRAYIYDPKLRGSKECPVVHVIEHSAYLALLKENEELRAERDEKRVQAIHSSCDKAVLIKERDEARTLADTRKLKLEIAEAELTAARAEIAEYKKIIARDGYSAAMHERAKLQVLRELLQDIDDGKYTYYEQHTADSETPSFYDVIPKVLAEVFGEEEK